MEPTYTGYCVKCRDKAGREITSAEVVVMKNGANAVRGKCAICGTGMYKILPKNK